MPAVYHSDTPLPEGERNARVYAGDIIIFRDFSSIKAFIELLRQHCRAVLGGDPERVHRHMAPAEVECAAARLRHRVLQDGRLARGLNQAFNEVGMMLEPNYGDRFLLRVQTPAVRAEEKGRTAALRAHRDTWGSNIVAQTNWWAPVFPTAPERTIALFPPLFVQAVDNNSAGWDFKALLRERKALGERSNYPNLPLATQPPSPGPALAISLLAGDLMCFSGAHLHASVPNTTERTRLSFETRTANGGDVAAGRGAPNVDGRAPRTAYRLFKGLTDGRKLGPSSSS